MNETKALRRTKIVCTIGPASSSPEMIRRLFRAGMDVARLNFSHGLHQEHLSAIKEIRSAAAEAGREVGILADLSGPKIRLGLIDGEFKLEAGGEVVLFSGQEPEENKLPVNYPYLYEDLALGDRILLADGKVELLVAEKKEQMVHCHVVVGGELTSHKGVNLPTSELRIPAFTEKDRDDLKFALSHEVDMVAMSFVRQESDLAPIREMMSVLKHPPLLIAKIEKPQALDHLENILAAVEGVMVARGDLGVEMPVEEVPVIQKRVIEEARRAGKVVITATQMLVSMTENPRPTRAEVTDVANAILDGTDAVMLSEETAMGAYPVEAVRMLDKVARFTEPTMDEERFLNQDLSGLLPQTEGAISRAVVVLAGDLNPVAILAATTSGSTARLVARYRPRLPVVGITSIPTTCRQLCLSWGVLPALIQPCRSVDQLLAAAKDWMRENRLAGQNDRFLLTAGIPLLRRGTTNLIKVVDMSGPDEEGN